MNFHPTNRRTALGFTLIELLVVISIVALLIAILLPALAKARATSRAITCQSKLRQVGIWATSYAVDNKGILPTKGGSDATSNYWYDISTTDWVNKAVEANLYKGPYTVDTPLHCPEARLQIAPMRSYTIGTSYGLNQYLGGQKKISSTKITPTPRMEILNSKGFWFGDARAFNSGGFDFHPVLNLANSATPSTLWPFTWPNATVPNAKGHPTENTNFLFGDGHGKSVSMSEFISMSSTERKAFVADPF